MTQSLPAAVIAYYDLYGLGAPGNHQLAVKNAVPKGSFTLMAHSSSSKTPSTATG
jgi:hypothetical protein